MEAFIDYLKFDFVFFVKTKLEKQLHLKVLVTWIAGVNFTNNFICSFYKQRSQKCKKYHPASVFFVLLGFSNVKSERKHVKEIDPRGQCHQHSTSSF
jgi:hypothetical protein